MRMVHDCSVTMTLSRRFKSTLRCWNCSAIDRLAAFTRYRCDKRRFSKSSSGTYTAKESLTMSQSTHRTLEVRRSGWQPELARKIRLT